MRLAILHDKISTAALLVERMTTVDLSESKVDKASAAARMAGLQPFMRFMLLKVLFMEAAASWRRRRDLAANAGLDAANVASFGDRSVIHAGNNAFFQCLFCAFFLPASSNPCCDATVCAQTAVQVVQLGGADSGVVRAANTQTIDLKHVCVDEKKLVQICKGALLSYACATRCPVLTCPMPYACAVRCPVLSLYCAVLCPSFVSQQSQTD